MARRNNAIQPVNSDEESRRKRTGHVARRDLCISQVWRDAQSAREERGVDSCRRERGHTEKSSRIRKRLDHAPVSAAEGRNVTNEPETKLIVEQPVVPANDRLRRRRPGEANSRRKVFFRNKL